MELEGRREPSKSAINSFKTFGIFILIVLMGAMIYSALIIALKLVAIKTMNISQIMIFGFMLRFITKLPLINVNYGNLLVYFMDNIFHLDLQLMINIRNEGGVRSEQNGKFEEYTIPVFFVNVILIQSCVYFVSTVLNYVALYLLDNKRSSIAAFIRNLHYFVMAFTMLDIITYGLNCLTEHDLNKQTQYWYGALALILLVISDLVHILILTWNSLSSVKAMEANGKINIFKYGNPVSELAKYQVPTKKAGSNVLAVILNFSLVLKLIFFTSLFTLTQTWPKSVGWILTCTQFVYLIFVITTFYGMGYIENGFVKLCRVIVEALMFVIFTIFLIFAYDPTNLRYMSKFTESLQWTAVFLIMIMIGVEILLFVYCSFTSLKAKPTKDDFVVFKKDKNGVVKKSVTYKVASDDNEMSVKPGMPENKISTFSRGQKRTPSPSANQNQNGYTAPAPADAKNGSKMPAVNKEDFSEGDKIRTPSQRPSVKGREVEVDVKANAFGSNSQKVSGLN